MECLKTLAVLLSLNGKEVYCVSSGVPPSGFLLFFHCGFTNVYKSVSQIDVFFVWMQISCTFLKPLSDKNVQFKR